MKLWKNKRARHGSYAAVFILIFFAVLILLNLFIGQGDFQLDLTRKKLFSLSERSQLVLNGLKGDITLYALYKPGQENEQILEILKKYDAYSDRLYLKIIDPDRFPGLMETYRKEMEEIPMGSLILQGEKDYRIIPYFDLYDISYNQSGQPQVMGMSLELKVTGALEYVASGYSPVLYFLTGHKEMSLEMLGLTKELNDNNFQVKEVNIQTTGSIPADADGIIMIGPESDISETEMKSIDTYLEKGGRAIFMLDYTAQETPVLSSLVSGYGIDIHRGFVFEKNLNRIPQVFRDVPTVFSPYPEAHPITDPLTENGLDVVMPGSQGLEISRNIKRNIEITPLFYSSDKSFIRTDMNNAGMEFSTGDTMGPVLTAAAVTRKKMSMNEEEGFRIVVTASSSILRPLPSVGKIKANIEFFMNSISWTVNRTDTETIKSKSFYRLPLRISSLQAFIYAGIFVVLIPLLLLLTGLIIWLKRRHL